MNNCLSDLNISSDDNKDSLALTKKYKFWPLFFEDECPKICFIILFVLLNKSWKYFEF